MFHERTLCIRIESHRFSSRNQIPRYNSHPAIATASSIYFAVGTYAFPGLPLLDALKDSSRNLVSPKVVNDTIAHCKNHVALF